MAVLPSIYLPQALAMLHGLIRYNKASHDIICEDNDLIHQLSRLLQEASTVRLQESR